jgi:hypothetical protein
MGSGSGKGPRQKRPQRFLQERPHRVLDATSAISSSKRSLWDERIVGFGIRTVYEKDRAIRTYVTRPRIPVSVRTSTCRLRPEAH